MALSPANAPKPAPASAKAIPAKAKALTILNNSTSSAPSNAPTPSNDGPQDLSEQLNAQIRQKYVQGGQICSLNTLGNSLHHINDSKAVVLVRVPTPLSTLATSYPTLPALLLSKR